MAQSDRAGYFLVHALVTPGSAGRNSPIGFVSSALPLEVLLQRAERRLPDGGAVTLRDNGVVVAGPG